MSLHPPAHASFVKWNFPLADWYIKSSTYTYIKQGIWEGVHKIYIPNCGTAGRLATLRQVMLQ